MSWSTGPRRPGEPDPFGDAPPPSRVKYIDEPSRADHLGSQGHGSLSQRTVRRHQGHLTGRVGRNRQQRVVTATQRVQDGHSVDLAYLDAAAGTAFEDHHHGLGQATVPHRSAHLLHQLAGCSRSILPPTVGPRADHVGRVHQKQTYGLRCITHNVRIADGDQALTGGRRSDQGDACSSWPASESRVSSSPKRPTNCTPMGSPASFQCRGSEIPGWPVTLNGGVNGT